MTSKQAKLAPFVQAALTGLLASEAGSDGNYYGEERAHPETGFKVFATTVAPLKKGSLTELDYNQPHILSRVVLTRPQHLAQEAVAIAVATLEELEKHDHTNNPA